MVLSATNADFFDMLAERSPYMPAGICIKDGQVLCNPHSMCTFFGMDRGESSTFIVKQEEELTMLNRPADLERPNEPLIREIFNSILIVKK